MVSNLVLSLIDKGCSYLSKCGVQPSEALAALMPLIENNLNSLKTKGFIYSLTGPVERGDLGTISKHLEVISQEDEELYKHKQALVLYQSLSAVKDLIIQGERDNVKIKSFLEKMINEKPLSNIDYISIVDADSLKDVYQIKNKTLIALAVKFGTTRLIDNLVVEV